MADNEVMFNLRAVVCMVSILLGVLVVVVGTAVFVVTKWIVPHYTQLVTMIQQSELVMCCVSNLCKNPVVNFGKCPLPPETHSQAPAVA